MQDKLPTTERSYSLSSLSETHSIASTQIIENDDHFSETESLTELEEKHEPSFQKRKIAQFLMSPAQMELAVLAMTEHARKKNYAFNCRVIDRNTKVGETDALVLFLKEINQPEPSAQQRTQVLYLSEQHWSVLDISCVNGQFHFIAYDAANSLPYTIPVLIEIRRQFPTATITYLGANFQREGRSCAYFSLDGANNLAKIKDLHQKMEHYPAKDKPYLDEEKNFIELLKTFYTNEHETWIQAYTFQELSAVIQSIRRFCLTNWPKELGSLVKNIQEKFFFELYFAGKNYLLHNGKSLDEYVRAHFHIDPLTGQCFSSAITEKKAKIDYLSTQYSALHFFTSQTHSPRNLTQSIATQDEVSTHASAPKK